MSCCTAVDGMLFDATIPVGNGELISYFEPEVATGDMTVSCDVPRLLVKALASLNVI